VVISPTTEDGFVVGVTVMAAEAPGRTGSNRRHPAPARTKIMTMMTFEHFLISTSVQPRARQPFTLTNSIYRLAQNATVSPPRPRLWAELCRRRDNSHRVGADGIRSSFILRAIPHLRYHKNSYFYDSEVMLHLLQHPPISYPPFSPILFPFDFLFSRCSLRSLWLYGSMALCPSG
jgi:hypothetical protein